MKLILRLLFTVVVAVVALIVLLLSKPELIINEPVFRRVAPFLAGMGYRLNWDEGVIQVHSESFFEKSIDIHFKNMCIDIVSVRATGCFEEIQAAAKIDFKNRKFHLLDLGPIKIDSQKFVLNLKPSPSNPSNRNGMFSELLTSETNIHELSFNLKGLNYISGVSNYQASIEVGDNGTLGHKRAWTLTGFLSARDEKSKANISSQFKLEGQKYLFAVPLKMVAKVKAQVGEKLNANAWVDLQFLKEEAADYQIQIDLHYGTELAVEAKLKGLLDGIKTSGQIDGTISSDGFKIPIGQNKDCIYGLDFDGKVNLNCAFQVLPQRALLKGLDLSKDFSLIHLVTEIHLTSENGLGTQGPWTGSARLDAHTDPGASVAVTGNFTSDLSKLPLATEALKNLEVKASAAIAISDFAKLVERLRPTPFAVPAPINVLAGTLQCKFNEDFKFSDLILPFKCETKLKSANQNLNTELSGTFGLKETAQKYKPNLDLKILFGETQIALPRFGLKGPPPIIPDRRFKKSLDVQKVDQAVAMDYIIHIDTMANKDMKILSNLVKSPVPVELHLVVGSGAKPKGTIHIKDFSVELFRREAQLKYFDLFLGQSDEELIHGMAEVHYTDYLVKVFLDGTVREPVIRFESLPPLGQDDIISVLLFGRKVDANDTDQGSSVSNTDAAIADKAVGLASMYLLASTPIESIGYNSQSQTFTAKFRLAEGTSLNIGAGDAGLREVGVNRHLGGPWYIYTALKNPSVSDDRSTAALLQWVLRY